MKIKNIQQFSNLNEYVFLKSSVKFNLEYYIKNTLGNYVAV